jgi:hypothetical protein
LTQDELGAYWVGGIAAMLQGDAAGAQDQFGQYEKILKENKPPQGCDHQKPKEQGPVPPGTLGATGSAATAVSRDPNQLTGPAGVGSRNWVAGESAFAYRVDFENEADATAPAQRVVVTNQLGANLDWATFEFTDLGFGETLIAAPERSQHFETTVGVATGGAFFNVEIVADFDVVTGLVRSSSSRWTRTRNCRRT